MEQDLCGLSATSLFGGSLRRRGQSNQVVRHAELVCIANQSPDAMKFINLLEHLRYSYRLGLTDETTRGLKEISNIISRKSDATLRIAAKLQAFDVVRQIAASQTAPLQLRQAALAGVLNILVGSEEETTKAVSPSFLGSVLDDFVFSVPTDQESLMIGVLLCDSLFQKSENLAHEFVKSGRFDAYVELLNSAKEREIVEILGFLVPTFLHRCFPIHFKRRVALLNCLLKLAQNSCDLLFLEGVLSFTTTEDVELKQKFFRDFDFESRTVQMLNIHKEKVVAMALACLEFMHKENNTAVPVRRVLELACCLDCIPVAKAAISLLCVFVKVSKGDAVAVLLNKRLYEFLSAEFESLAFAVKEQVILLFALTVANSSEKVLLKMESLRMFDIIFGNLRHDQPKVLKTTKKMVLSLAKSEFGLDILMRNAGKIFHFLEQVDEAAPEKSAVLLLTKYLQQQLQKHPIAHHGGHGSK